MKQTINNTTTPTTHKGEASDGPHCIRCAIGQASLVIVIVALCVYFFKLV